MKSGDFTVMARPLRKNLLSNSIYEELRDGIIAADIQPGERLQVMRIAQAYGTSQAPVREALTRLEQDGLVMSEPYKGTSVVSLSTEDIEDILTLRITTDDIALARAIPRMHIQHIEALTVLIEKMREAARNDDRETLAENDIAFHSAICEHAGSHFLNVTWSSIVTQARLASATANRYSDPRNLNQIAEMHADILEAIKRRDVASAKKANRKHLEFAFTNILHVNESKEEQPVPEAASD